MIPLYLQEIVDLIGKVGPLIIGIIVAIIAWRQWTTQHSKLRLELFDRRYAIWEDFAKVRASIEFQGTVETSHRETLAMAARMVPFFFKSLTLEYIAKDVFNHGYHASVLCNGGRRSSPDADDRLKVFDEAQAAMKLYCDTHDVWVKSAKKQMRISI